MGYREKLEKYETGVLGEEKYQEIKKEALEHPFLRKEKCWKCKKNTINLHIGQGYIWAYCDNCHYSYESID